MSLLVESANPAFLYIGLFLLVMLEGELSLLGAAVLAAQGILWLPMVILVAALGNVAIDQFYYRLALRWGRGILQRMPRLAAVYDRAEPWLIRRRELALLFGRYLYGFRIAVPAGCGLTGMCSRRFALLNVTASLLWAVSTAYLGVLFGHAIIQAFVRFGWVASGTVAGALLLAFVLLTHRKPKAAALPSSL